MSFTVGGAQVVSNYTLNQPFFQLGCGMAALVGADNGHYDVNVGQQGWTALVTINFSAAQANYANLTISLWDYCAVGGPSLFDQHGEVRITTGGVQRGNSIIHPVTYTKNYAPLIVTLTAGTDYVRGTAFTAKVEVQIINSHSIAGTTEVAVEGISVIGGL